MPKGLVSVASIVSHGRCGGVFDRLSPGRDIIRFLTVLLVISVVQVTAVRAQVAAGLSLADAAINLVDKVPEAAKNAYCDTLVIHDVHERRVKLNSLKDLLADLDSRLVDVESGGDSIVGDIDDYLTSPSPKLWNDIVKESRDQFLALSRLNDFLYSNRQLKLQAQAVVLADRIKMHDVGRLTEEREPKSSAERNQLKTRRDRLANELAALESARKQLEKYIGGGSEGHSPCP